MDERKERRGDGRIEDRAELGGRGSLLKIRGA